MKKIQLSATQTVSKFFYLKYKRLINILTNPALLKNVITNYFFVIPGLLMFLIFSIYPFYKILQLSLFEWNGLPGLMKFVWFRNYIDAFVSREWWISVWNAGYVTLLALTLQNALALILALIVDKEIRGKNFYRVVFYLPPVLSGIVVGLVWDWIYNGNYGLLNHWLSIIGLDNLTRAWLSEPKTALTAVGIIHMWKGFGWGFIILLAGLQSIPRELYEAARVDGAGERMIFLKVTVPLMIPVFFLVSILTILGTMQIFDIIVATTRGGPGYHTEVPITRILAHMTGDLRFGFASSLGFIFGIILFIVSMMQLKLSKRLKVD
ncbi:MAG: sugar ABC transporter permease [bacterium]